RGAREVAEGGWNRDPRGWNGMQGRTANTNEDSVLSTSRTQSRGDETCIRENALEHCVLLLLAIGIGFFMTLTSCSSVPKEVVELSYRMGGDLSAVHDSERKLIHEHFEFLRRERMRYLNDEWSPLFISQWVKDGRLIDVARGEVVWSTDSGDFVTPLAGQEQKDLLATVGFWANAATSEIEAKR